MKNQSKVVVHVENQDGQLISVPVRLWEFFMVSEADIKAAIRTGDTQFSPDHDRFFVHVGRKS